MTGHNVGGHGTEVLRLGPGEEPRIRSLGDSIALSWRLFAKFYPNVTTNCYMRPSPTKPHYAWHPVCDVCLSVRLSLCLSVLLPPLTRKQKIVIYVHFWWLFMHKNIVDFSNDETWRSRGSVWQLSWCTLYACYRVCHQRLSGPPIEDCLTCYTVSVRLSVPCPPLTRKRKT